MAKKTSIPAGIDVETNLNHSSSLRRCYPVQVQRVLSQASLTTPAEKRLLVAGDCIVNGKNDPRIDKIPPMLKEDIQLLIDHFRMSTRQVYPPEARNSLYPVNTRLPGWLAFSCPLEAVVTGVVGFIGS